MVMSKYRIILVIALLSLLYVGTHAQNKFEKRTNPDNYLSPVMKAIAYGITAPSPHNSQSLFIDTISDTEMYLYIKHVLPATDPPARQIHMGAGCFIELLSVGMSKEGYEIKVDYLPEGDYTVRSYTIAEKPIAKITLVKNKKIRKSTLYDYIYLRGTNRRPYTGRMITREEFDQIKKLMGISHSKLVFISEKKQLKPYLDIFSQAMEIETRSKLTNEETRQMFRFNEEERTEKKDGISIPQMGYSGLIEKIAEKSLHNGDSITWHSEKNIRATMKSINKGIYSAKGVIIFNTNTNTKIDWVKSGRDYARFNLAIAKMGLVTHPYNQVIQEYKEMEELQKKFNTLTNIGDGEKSQMIVRVGRAKSTYKSWRKLPESYIME